MKRKKNNFLKIFLIVFISLMSVCCFAKIHNQNNSLFSDLGIKLQSIINKDYYKEVDFEDFTLEGNISGGQDGAIYDGYLFSFGSNGACTVYSMESLEEISNFTLDKSDLTAPHSNSVCFGTEKYDKDDIFPLLYSNIYNNDANKLGTTNVYRIIKEKDTFSSKLVQVIKVGFTNDSEKWASGIRPYGNFVIDTDNKDLWTFVMDDISKTTKWFQFDLPKLSEGEKDKTLNCNVVTLKYDDVLNQFETDYINYMQGCCYFGGKIYSSEGFTNDSVNIPSIRVIDIVDHKLIKTVNLVKEFNLNAEPEFLSIYDNKLYYKDVNGKLISFDIVD